MTGVVVRGGALGAVTVVALLMLAQPVAAGLYDEAEQEAVGVVREVAPECPQRDACEAIEFVARWVSSYESDPCRKLPGSTPEGPLSCPIYLPGLPEVWDDSSPSEDTRTDPEPLEVVSTTVHVSDTSATNSAHTGVRPDAKLGTDDALAVPTDRPYGGVASLAGLLILGLVAVPLLWLFRRLSKDELLDNEIRNEALDLVDASPGATPSEVARELDVHPSTARYHLDLLCEFDYLARRRFEGNVRYFTNHGRYSDVDKAVADAMSSTGRRDVLLALARCGRLSVGAIAERIDRADSTVSNHVAKLRKAGLLDRERDGRRVHYELPDRVRRAMLRVM